MAIDFTQSRDKYPDRCKYVKGVYVDKMELTQDAVVQGVFYSTDEVAQTLEEVVQGNIKRKQYTITLATPDILTDLTTDDYVLYIDGYLWRVRKMTVDDKTESKEFSKRPSARTLIEMYR